jgi:mannobiose 2-epimerase
MSGARVAPLLAMMTVLGATGKGGAQADAARIHQRIDTFLRDEMTRLWYPRAVDRERGGFHQTYARDWSPRPDTNAFLVYQSRMTWTAAAFAEYPGAPRDELLGYARHGVSFLDKVMRDREHGGFHFVVGPDGEVDPRQGTEKHVYGTAFALYAASRAYRATRDVTALRVAKDAFNWLEEHAHDDKHGGYFEAVTREGKPIITYDPAAPVNQRTDRLGVYYGFKSMNSHIHLLEAVAEYHHAAPSALGEKRLRELLEVVRDKVAVEPGALNLYLTRDWRAIPAHDSFGHDVETAYLLVEAAEALGFPEDEKTWTVARALVDHALEWGWDEQFGGFYDKGDSFAGQAYDTKKVWWTQAEGLNALLVMHRKFGKQTDRYWRAFLKQWELIEKHIIDPEYGGWYAETTREGKLLGDGGKAQQWKANYHTGRAMMNVATMLKEEKDQ